MQCDCKTKAAEKVGEHVVSQLTEGFKDFDAGLSGYSFMMAGNKMTARFTVKYEGEVWVPKKRGGGYKRKKIDVVIAAKYCPFCGEPAEPQSDQAAQKQTIEQEA